MAGSKREGFAPRRYRVAGSVVAVAGTAPFLQIAGAAGGRVRVASAIISGLTLTAATVIGVSATRRTGLSSGGTPVAITPIPVDVTHGVDPTATASAYTAAPTGGTPLGVVGARGIFGAAAATPVSTDAAVFDFRNPDSQNGATLPLATDALTFEFIAAPGSATTVRFEVEIEED